MTRILTAFCFSLWAASVIACGFGKKKAEPDQQEVEQKPAAKSDQPAKQDTPELSWAPPTKVVKQGDVQVQIAKATIGKVPLTDLGRKGSSSKDALLMVNLNLLNINQTKKVDYKTWSGRDIAFDRDFATLKDNFGNNYKRISFGFGTRPSGAVERAESIYPNKTVSDVLVFEVPLDTVTHLDLELPAQNYGSEGMVRFRIPITFVIKE